MSTFSKLGFLSLVPLLMLSSLVTAASAEINWNAPESYSDIRASGKGTSSGFQRQLFSQLERHIASLAKALPEDQVLTLDVTDVRLAGNLRPARGTEMVRVIQSNNYPAKMSFSYKLTDKAGTSLMQGEETITSSTADVRTGQNESWGVEKNMLTSWFNKTFK